MAAFYVNNQCPEENYLHPVNPDVPDQVFKKKQLITSGS